jgi:hypothetical protein
VCCQKEKQTAIKNIAVSINKELQFFIDKEPVSETELESKLLAMLANDKTKAIILRAEEGVPIEKAVNVLDIANQIKVVLAVRPKYLSFKKRFILHEIFRNRRRKKSFAITSVIFVILFVLFFT